ncbi:DNA-directed RNA polymerase subunit beta [Nocardia brasiliensis]|uniref:DNA-directed RNA polymerase subunit beta n=1 Tax=Nocardia brasiliensis TaxID=37326 RepID=A0A6G9XJC1_NOCBR|nr:DNA-directed RNA polymerase subunit beta [Nocardia brasiliensis]QIS01008.1 DNA-directed RNA polymerase subunit beta [Nocardia brasiliensis]
MTNTEIPIENRAAALESSRRFYQVTCGLPARVRPEFARLEFTVGSVGAVTMPARVGALVKARLLARPNGQAGPVISHPRSKRWTFLVCPDIPYDIVLFAELARHNVSVVPIGGEVPLPSPFDPLISYREWVLEPINGFRPRGTEVVDAVRACLSIAGR